MKTIDTATEPFDMFTALLALAMENKVRGGFLVVDIVGRGKERRWVGEGRYAPDDYLVELQRGTFQASFYPKRLVITDAEDFPTEPRKSERQLAHGLRVIAGKKERQS